MKDSWQHSPVRLSNAAWCSGREDDEVARGLKILEENKMGWDPGFFDSSPDSTCADRYLSIRGYTPT